MTEADSKMARHWCMAAMQLAPNKAKQSLVAFAMNGANCSCPIFKRWCKKRMLAMFGLDGMGPAPRGMPAAATAAGVDPVMAALLVQQQQMGALMHQLANNQGVPGMANGHQQLQQPTQPAASPKEDILKKNGMDEDLLAAVCGFSGTSDPTKLTLIWKKWCKTTKFRTHRRDLIRGVKAWGDVMGLEVDPGLFLTKEQIQDMVQGNWNPGECLATFYQCDKGCTLLMAQAMSLTQKQKHKAREEAEDVSVNNRSLAEALQLKSTDPPAPPSDFAGLKLLTATFAGVLATVFGAGNTYYQDILGARMVLKEEGVALLAEQFTPLKIRQYCWAFIDEGRRHFAQVLAPEDFVSGRPIRWPTSGLKDVIWKMRNVEHIERPTFPQEWRSKVVNAQARGNGGIGGGTDALWFPQMNMGALPPFSGLHQLPPGGPAQFQFGLLSPPTLGAGGGDKGGEKKGDGRMVDDEELARRLAHLHPTISQCMKAYHKKFRGRVMLSKNLTAANKDISHLPKLDTGNGKCDACYFHMLGYCGRQNATGSNKCRYHHIADMNMLPDQFPETLCSVIAPGLAYVVKNEVAAPPKRGNKRKQD